MAGLRYGGLLHSGSTARTTDHRRPTVRQPAAHLVQPMAGGLQGPTGRWGRSSCPGARTGPTRWQRCWTGRRAPSAGRGRRCGVELAPGPGISLSDADRQEARRADARPRHRHRPGATAARSLAPPIPARGNADPRPLAPGAHGVPVHRSPARTRPRGPFDQTSGVGRGRRLLFHDVPEGKVGKNRLHLDVHSEPGGLGTLVALLEELGQPASARSTRGLPGTGGSCRTRKATSSAQRRSSRRRPADHVTVGLPARRCRHKDHRGDPLVALPMTRRPELERPWWRCRGSWSG